MLWPAQIRMARAALGWSLAELAKHAHVNPNTISRYETGSEVMSGVLKKLETALLAQGVVFQETADSIAVTVPLAKLR